MLWTVTSSKWFLNLSAEVTNSNSFHSQNIHFDLFCDFRHCLGHFVEYLDVEDQPVVTYAEFEEQKTFE